MDDTRNRLRENERALLRLRATALLLVAQSSGSSAEPIPSHPSTSSSRWRGVIEVSGSFLSMKTASSGLRVRHNSPYRQ
jgi:hypothetical protein